VDPANIAGSYYRQLKSVQVNRIKLDAIFDRRVLPSIIAFEGGKAAVSEPTEHAKWRDSGVASSAFSPL
jgi:hypothetical protein